MPTFRSSTQYSMVGEDPSVPARRAGTRQADRSRYRERHWLTKVVGSRQPSMWLVIHTTCLTLVTISAFIFWWSSFEHPILYPLSVQQTLTSKPKIATAVWTSIGTLLSAMTVYFLNGVLYHTVAQKIAYDGATVSSIEVWNKLANQKALLSRSRWRMSLFTVVAWVSAAFLTSGYTTLVTPTSIAISGAMNGTEIDFTSPSFWDWYNTFDPKTGRPVRKIFGCTWYRYSSSTGKAVFPTCPFLGDPSSFLAAGIVAAQTANGIFSTTRAMNTLFNGTTGGTLAIGYDGVAAFDNIQADAPAGYAVSSYNYSLIQQGLTAYVDCRETVEVPIMRKVVGAANVTDAPLGVGEEILQSFQLNDTTNNCQQWQQVITSASASVACAICQPDHTLKEYLIYLQPFGAYTEQNLYSGSAAFPNLTCSLQPRLTINNVSYSAATGLFTSTVLDVDSRSYLVPNETAESIHLLVNIAATSWGNMVIDALYALQMTGHSTISMPKAVEAMLRGFIEFEGTNLRMYYTANEAPGLRNITGIMTSTRLGYAGQRTVLYFLVPPLAVTYCLCIVYLFVAIRTGVRYSGTFDPTNSTCLILGGAAAGKNERLAVVGDGSGVDKLEKRGVLEMRVKFEEGAGLVDAWSGGTKLGAL